MWKMGRRHRPAWFESVETRTLFTTVPWGTAPSRMNLDDLVANHPDILGAGQTIAVIDTGIDYRHASLGGGFGEGHKVVGGYDFADSDNDPLDTDGHGTAVAGIIAADEFETGGFRYRGIAPQAQLVALRIASNTSDVPLEKIEQALQWVITNAETYDIRIVNLSFGYGRFESYFSDPTLSNELNALRELDIAFVSSAGNAGTSTGFGITAPGSDASAISVGSVSGSDIISEFSQRSANLSILAVGENVRSAAVGGGFGAFDGTSFAAPAVSGTIALMRQIDPTFTAADAKSILRAAMPRNYDGDQEIGTTSGYTFPRLDVNRAIEVAQLRAAAPAEVQATVGQAGNENDVIFDSFGVMHFVYYDNDAKTMKYAVKSLGGNWSTPSLIDNSVERVGTEFSLKLDSFGAPRLAYLDSPNGDLKFGRLDSANWTTTVLDSSGVTGLYPSLTIDPFDRYWISYLRKTNWDLRVMEFDGSTWNRETIDTDGKVGYSTSIALDQNGRPGIAYGNGTYRQLKYAHLNDDGNWDIEVVEPNTYASYLSLAYDASNRPRVSYYTVDSADLKYSEYNGTQWRHTRIASRGATGLYSNLFTNFNGDPLIFFWDRRSNSLHKAVRSNSTWNVSRVTADAGKYLFVGLSTVNGKYTTISNRSDRLIFNEVVS